MANLNFLSHLIFFIVIVFFVDQTEITDAEYSNQDKEMLDKAVNTLKWGHLICFISQLSCLILKKLDDFIYIAQVLMVIFNVVFYFLPLIYALYCFKEMDLNPLTLEVNNDYEGMI